MFDPERFAKSPVFKSPPDLVTTHISWVFIGDELVYKVKRPVNFGFLDFSTLEKRRYYCHREVELNRRASPEIYLGVEEIRERDGSYMVGGEGELVDYCVVMRRMDRERMMDVLLERDALTEEEVERVARKVVEFHRIAGTSPEILQYGSTERIRENTDENFEQIRPFLGETISETLYSHLVSWTEERYRERGMFEGRVKKERIKDCHGDLYSRNICVMEKIYLYDCIEFNDRFRYIDVASDLAFLLMDLEFHKKKDFSQRVQEVYIEGTGEGEEFWDVLEFYKVYRAVVRGKVHSFMGRDDPKENFPLARRYFQLAGRYTGLPPKVVFFIGPTGTGKSTCAQAFSSFFRADYFNTDVERRRIFGIPVGEKHFDPFGRGLYSPEKVEKVYRVLMEKAEGAIQSLSPLVVLDGTFLTRGRRAPFVGRFKRLGAELFFVYFDVDEETVRRRLSQREKEQSVSDGRWEIYQRHIEEFEPPGEDEGRVFVFQGGERLESIIKTLGEELCLI